MSDVLLVLFLSFLVIDIVAYVRLNKLEDKLQRLDEYLANDPNYEKTYASAIRANSPTTPEE